MRAIVGRTLVLLCCLQLLAHTRTSMIPTGDATMLPAGNFRFLLPIAQSGIDANPVIRQNPGYER